MNRDSSLLALIAQFLAGAGCNTIATWARPHALKWIECKSFDVVIDGYSGMSLRSVHFLETVRRKQPAAVLIVVHEAPLESGRLTELHEMGVHAAISKWNLKELVQTVQLLKTPHRQPATFSDSAEGDTSPPGGSREEQSRLQDCEGVQQHGSRAARSGTG